MSTEIFDQQSEEYKKEVLHDGNVTRIALEAATTGTWYKYLNADDIILGIDKFGASAPYEVLFDKYGLTADHLVDVVEKVLSK